MPVFKTTAEPKRPVPPDKHQQWSQLPPLGAELRRWLFERPMTQARLAGLMGCSIQYVSMVIHGRKTPSEEFLEKLQKVLQLSAEEEVVLRRLAAVSGTEMRLKASLQGATPADRWELYQKLTALEPFLSGDREQVHG